ncbi:unnamed protein product [Meganyctiphanes norvegica]|uniref:Uncharacterized protein n=1 Tax=Meganyctiphanes norvegica TaxID=48144 RepID=A0AAV2RL84_MEGNR
MTDRAAQYCIQDKKTTSLTKKRMMKTNEGEMWSQKQKRRENEFDYIIELSEDEPMEDYKDIKLSSKRYCDFEEIQPTPRRSHKRTVKTDTTIYILPDVLKSHILVSAFTRNKVPPTVASAICHYLITACNGSPSVVQLHYTAAYRYKVEIHSSIVEKIKSTWSPPDTALV